jgi:hypothetical protein
LNGIGWMGIGVQGQLAIYDDIPKDELKLIEDWCVVVVVEMPLFLR